MLLKQISIFLENKPGALSQLIHLLADNKIDLEALCRAMGFERVRVVDPYNLKQCDEVLKEELSANAPSVIISRRPCALLKYVKHNPPLNVNRDKCVGCKSCMKIGCPAISMKDGKASIDNTLCVGCNVCSQLCPSAARLPGAFRFVPVLVSVFHDRPYLTVPYVLPVHASA